MMMTVITHAIAFGVGVALMAIFGLRLRAELRRMRADYYIAKRDLTALKKKIL